MRGPIGGPCRRGQQGGHIGDLEGMDSGGAHQGDGVIRGPSRPASGGEVEALAHQQRAGG